MQQPFDFEDKNELDIFLKGDLKEIKVPGSDKKIQYDPLSRTGVGISKMGASKAISIGSYAFALNALDKK